ncbi:hypothetical protein PanWU01x14_154160 [Parasponia andersonii]|uniref:Uncharacterized protein n=1 Tax=Parasponia andersonii TaxID=3476 RepID=A0A2P5CGT8_PARAD|nr:hypothetical protein PanWU01x14_154160 [Parasponia andersonii]
MLSQEFENLVFSRRTELSSHSTHTITSICFHSPLTAVTNSTSLTNSYPRAINTPSGHDSATDQFPPRQPMSLANITTILPPSIHVIQQSWILDPASQMLNVKKQQIVKEQKLNPSKLQNLTEYVLYLEH